MFFKSVVYTSLNVNKTKESVTIILGEGLDDMCFEHGLDRFG